MPEACPLYTRGENVLKRKTGHTDKEGMERFWVSFSCMCGTAP